MAICPKCHLPNPEGVPTCIWCGGHRFESASNEAVVTVADPVPQESHFESAIVVTPMSSSPLVESFHTPNTPAPEHRPLPSHVGLMLTPRPKTGAQKLEPRTVATS